MAKSNGNGKSQANGNGNGKHRKNTGLSNLMPPWPKGVTGNPNGRPKGPSLKAVMDAELMSLMPDGKMTRGEALIKAALVKAIKGDPRFAKLVLERVFPATQHHEVKTEITTQDIIDRLDRLCAQPAD